jgi:RNA polymerase sigma factor (sigma-70 family)
VTEDQRDLAANQLEGNRERLRALAYRMLGSLTDADDALQEAWLRINRSDPGEIENLGGWLTTVVARVCLDMLRWRASRREESLDVRLPDPVVDHPDALDLEGEAVLADSVGLALLVLLEQLDPAERLAFVLHDTFGVPFDEIATITDRTPAAARQLASRARRRVQGAPIPDADLSTQRRAVQAFMAASRNGDFAALLAVLDPTVVFRSDAGSNWSRVIRGAPAVAKAAAEARSGGAVPRPALVNGAAGAVLWRDGRPVGVLGFTVVGGLIVEIDVLADPVRLRRLNLGALWNSPRSGGGQATAF